MRRKFADVRKAAADKKAAATRDDYRRTYSQNLGRKKFRPTKRNVGNFGDKVVNAARNVGNVAREAGGDFKDMLFPTLQMGKKGLDALLSNIQRSKQNREILGDAYTDDLRTSMMTDDDLKFYNKYVGLADMASTNRERDRLMGVANTAMQNAQITNRINYALGQPEFGFETTAPAGIANIDYSTLADRMVGGTDDSVGLEGSAVGKEFLKRAYEAQAGESGDNMISDSIKNKYDIADFFPMSRDLAPQFTTADIPYTQRFPNIFSDPEISKRLDEVGFFERDMVSPKEPNTFVGGNNML